MGKKRHIQGAGRHTTVTEAGGKVFDFATGLKTVKSVKLGKILPGGSRDKKPILKVDRINPATLSVKVTARGQSQILQVNCKNEGAATGTTRALRRKFPTNFTDNYQKGGR